MGKNPERSGAFLPVKLWGPQRENTVWDLKTLVTHWLAHEKATTGGEEVANEHFWAKRIFPDAKHHKTKVEVSSVAVISFAKHLSTQTHSRACRCGGGRGSPGLTLDTNTPEPPDWMEGARMREVRAPESVCQIAGVQLQIEFSTVRVVLKNPSCKSAKQSSFLPNFFCMGRTKSQCRF